MSTKTALYLGEEEAQYLAGTAFVLFSNFDRGRSYYRIAWTDKNMAQKASWNMMDLRAELLE